MLYRKKLEYDYRIYEQELLQMSLALSVYMKKEAEDKLV